MRSSTILFLAFISCTARGELALGSDLTLPEVSASWKALPSHDIAKLHASLDELIEQGLQTVDPAPNDGPKQLLAKADRIFTLNDLTRQRIDQLWKRRSELSRSIDQPEARRSAAAFLKTISAWVEFSGRLRYATREHVAATVKRLPRPFVSQLIKSAQQHRVGIVAPALAFVLVQPPPGSKALPFDGATRLQLLRLIKATREIDATPAIYELLRWPHTPDSLRIHLIDTLREIGISLASDDNASRRSPKLLLEQLQAIDAEAIDKMNRTLRLELIAWLEQITADGLADDAYRWGPAVIHPGDWILQRNPSPYNRFTDLSPGLFTHVGIAAATTDHSGRRRIVIVDLPETGTKIKATPADQFVSKSLHWIVVRHRNPDSAKAMGRVAARLVGRAAEFDLTFNTSLIKAQSGLLDREDPVRTYCAGFLALCAQEAGLRRSDLFPFTEYPINDQCRDNLKGLGLTMTDFVSPNGPLFSPDMKIVGSRAPMYSPGNEIKEAVYDRFALQLSRRRFRLQQTTAQRLRQQLAEMSSDYAWVRSALANANNVNPAMDLVVAARVATIVENLDSIAENNEAAYREAIEMVGKGLMPKGVDPHQIAGKSKYVIKKKLVKIFIGRGEDAVDAMFFASD